MASETAYQAAVAEIEQRIGWTVEQGENCGCNFHPEGPCDRCWSLGWAIGGINEKDNSQ